SSGRDTSPRCTTACPPAARIFATTRSAASEATSETTTCKPLAASKRAAASPIPEPAPVTSTALPLKLYFIVIPLHQPMPQARRSWSLNPATHHGNDTHWVPPTASRNIKCTFATTTQLITSSLSTCCTPSPLPQAQNEPDQFKHSAFTYARI